MITISGTLSKGWMHQALGVVFDRPYYFDPAKRHAIDRMCNEYAADRFPGMGLFYSESNLGRLPYWGKDQVQIGGIQPNMILAMLLGADFVPADDRDPDVTPNCLAAPDPTALPSIEDLLDHELVRLFDGQIAQIQNHTDSPLRPIPPFFWDASGRATIHGVLTTAQKLCGENFFLSMTSEPVKCLGLLDWIADAYVVLCRHFSQTANLPIAALHVGECSACMVGPAMIDAYVVTPTSRIGRALGPIRLHSCGPSTHLLEVFARIEPLQSLDLGGTTSIAKTRELFGPNMPISIAPLPQHLSADDSDPIVSWAAQILEDNRDGDIEFVYHLEAGYRSSNVLALTDFVVDRGGRPSQ